MGQHEDLYQQIKSSEKQKQLLNDSEKLIRIQTMIKHMISNKHYAFMICATQAEKLNIDLGVLTSTSANDVALGLSIMMNAVNDIINE